MNRHFLTSRVVALALLGLLAGCGDGSAGGTTAAEANTVSVTTVLPQRQAFHDTIEAVGTAVGDPRRSRTLSLAYGGQIVGEAVIAGQSVKRGQPLLTIRADPATRQAYQQAQAASKLARGELRRTEQLAAQRLATQSQIAAARKSLADAQAALKAQEAIGGRSASHAVVAPTDGVVTALRVALGDRVAANAPLLDFTPVRSLVAQLGVQPENGEKLRAGMSVQLRSVYGPAEGFTGTLRMVGRSVDARSHLLLAQVELPASASARMVAGAAVTARIETSNFEAWAVPRDAVLHDDQGNYLFQARDGHAKRVDVELRNPHGNIVAVQGPIDPRAPIIVLGVYELSDGDAIRAGTRNVDARQAPEAASTGTSRSPQAGAGSSR